MKLKINWILKFNLEMEIRNKIYIYEYLICVNI